MIVQSKIVNSNQTEDELSDRPQVKESIAVKEDQPSQSDVANQTEASSVLAVPNHQTVSNKLESQTVHPIERHSTVPSSATNQSNVIINTTKEFGDLNIPKGLHRQLYKQGVVVQNRLQQELMPYLLNPGSETPDIFVCSSPHLGKKTAFITAALTNINSNREMNQVVVVCPTLPLAKQAAIYARKLAHDSRIIVKYIMHNDRPVDGQLIFSTIDALPTFNLLGTIDIKQVYLGECS